MNKANEVIAVSNAAVAEAERCRREARETIAKDSSRYGELSGQPSGWCVVTQGGLWSRKFHDRLEESRLRDCIQRGHKVVLTVGLVAKPDSPLSAGNHLAVVAISERARLSGDKLSMITVRAKMHAACALIN